MALPIAYPSELVSDKSTGKTTQEIRTVIRDAVNDREFFEQIMEHLTPQGTAGSQHHDHCIAAQQVLAKTELDKTFPHLNTSQTWGHLFVVLKRLGYVFHSGYIVAHEPPANMRLVRNDKS